MVEVEVTLNCTDKNPFHQYGLKANPFPATENNQANHILRNLSSEPIKDLDDLRKRLSGCAPEFIEECCRRYTPGHTVRFKVLFDHW